MGTVQGPALSTSHPLSFKSAGPLQRGKQEHSSTVVFYPGCVFKSLVDFLNMLCLITADQLNQHEIMRESRHCIFFICQQTGSCQDAETKNKEPD